MFRSTFASFTTATLALRANQRALDVTGQNIANINTDGYTRQRLDLVSFNLNNGSYINPLVNTNPGYGVKIAGISQIRDPFLDIQYRNQIAKVGTADAKQATLDLLQGIFDETGTDGIKTALGNLISSLGDFSAKPTDEFDTIIRSRCQTLVNLFSTRGNELSDLRERLTSEMKDTHIPEVNNILKSIGELNESIWNSQMLGNPALELKDQLNAKLDTLASYIPIEVTYQQRKISSDTTLSVPVVKLVGSNGNKYDLINGNNGEDFGEFVYSFDAANNKVELSLRTAGTAIPEPPAVPVTENVTDVIGGGTLRGCLDMLNQSGEFDDPPSDVRGIGYYEQSFNLFVSTFAKTMNSLNVDPDDPAAKIQPLFTPTDAPAGTKPEDYVFTAKNIQVNPDWINGTVKLVTAAKPNAGSTENNNILNFIQALDGSREFTYSKGGNGSYVYFTGNISQCYANIENTQGIDSSANTAILNNHISVVQRTQDNRDSVSGVSLDEEGISILQYQRSYSAAARLMTALDEALDVLINKTGVVGR